MGELFKGWRRKIGVVTLVMACSFMGLWVRSQSVSDWFMFTVQPGRLVFLISYPNGLMWVRSEFKREVRAGAIWSPVPITKNDFDERIVFSPRDELVIEWRWKWMGFCFSINKDSEERIRSQNGLTLNREAFWFVPHWSIVIPLTLLAAWLLLSKPRSKPAKPQSPSFDSRHA
jgi:hypothetical protein